MFLTKFKLLGYSLVAFLLLQPVAAKADVEQHTLGKAAQGLPCPGTKDGFDKMLSVLNNQDQAGLDEIMQNGFYLHQGDRVLIIDHQGVFGLVVQMRMLTGKNARKACWESSDTPGLFQ